MKTKICFIVNPTSGIGSKGYLPNYIDKYLDQQQYEYSIRYTRAPRHATELARKAVAEGAMIVVAVGGDGSVNEVAEGLLGSNVALGILPMGSGNAFATHWGISRRLRQAIEVINAGEIAYSDIVYVNNRLMLATSGVGFAAHVAYLIKGKRVRGFFRYLSIALQTAWTYKSKTYRVQFDENGVWHEQQCFILEVSNVKYYGYGVQIAPTADAQDGLLNIGFIAERPRLRYVQQLFRMWNGTIHQADFMRIFTAKTVQIILPHSGSFHRDGEGEFSSATVLNYRIEPKALKIIVK